MVIAPAAVSFGFFIKPAAFSNIDLTANDGFDSRFSSLIIKGNHAEHISVFRESDGIHIQVINGVNQLIYTLSTIQQTVIGMVMQMNKFRRHYRVPI